MKTETYCLPIIIRITDEEPNKIAKLLADAIFDGMQEALESNATDCEKVEVEYSIFVKGKEFDFREEIII